MPEPSVHARIRSIVTALDRGETDGLREQVTALHHELESSDRPVVDRLALVQELGRVMVALGEPAIAAGWFQGVLDYWQDHAPVQGRVRVLVATGDLALALTMADRDDDARSMADAAREGLRDLERSAPEQVLRFAAGLARVYDRIGPIEIARELWLTALRYVPVDAPSEGDALLVALGDLERRAGRVAAADVRLGQAERLVDRTRPLDHPVRAAVLSARARFCADLGRIDEAIEHLEAAVNVRVAARRARTEEQVEDLARLATWTRRRGQSAVARRHLDSLGTIVATRGRESAEMAAAIDALGVAAAEARDLSAAHAAFETARDLAASRGDDPARTQADLRAAWVVHTRARTPETRRAFLEAAGASSRTVARPPALVLALVRAHLEEGDPTSAFERVTSALDALSPEERLGTPLLDGMITAAVELAGTGVDVAAPAYEWLLRTMPPAAAARVSRHRAVTAYDPALDAIREAIDIAVDLEGRARAVTQLGSGDRSLRERATSATAFRHVLEGELDRLAEEATSSVTVHDVARGLGVDAWLLHLHRFRHVVGDDERDVAFAISGNTGAAYVRALGEASAIDKSIRLFREEDPGSESSGEAGLRLAGRLLGPLRTLAGLRPGDRLHVVPSEAWASVPLAALPSPSGEGGPWVVHHELVTLLDPRSLVAPRAGTTPTGPRVTGAPALEPLESGPRFDEVPGLREAAERAASVLGVAPWLGPESTTSAIADAPSPRVLVVATHAYALDDGDAGLVGSGALASLAPGAPVPGLGWLSADALARAEFSGTEVLDLAACALPAGRELEVATALAGAGRRAGAGAVVVAVGPVSDDVRVSFTRAFYQSLSAGEPPARAVRSAQIELSARFGPEAWGAFRCIGDGTSRGAVPLLGRAALGPSDLACAELRVGAILGLAGQPERALEAFDRAFAHDPRISEIQLARGRCLEELGRYAEAVPAYREASRLEPADGTARYALARLFLRGGETEHAVEELTELGRQFPGDPQVWRDLVQVYRQAKEWPLARQCAERWLAVAREDDMAWHHYATILEAVDEPQKAQVARERTVELAPGHALHWSNLGVHFARRGRFEQAELNLRKAVELDPAHAPSWRNLAQVRLELDRPADAESSARKAVERDPENAGGHFLLGMALKALERVEESRAALERSAALGHPGASVALGTLG